jgi:diketogulonate reductase-like aldo/keto reductase
MERCVKRGLARHIGVSNFAISHLESILEIATIRPALDQIEMHPYLQQPNLLAYLRQNNIQVQGFASLTPLTKASPGPVDDICKRLTAKYGVSESAILFRWAIDQGVPVVTTSGNRKRLQGYVDELAAFHLRTEEVEELSRAGKTKRVRGFFADEFRAFEQAQYFASSE